MATQIEEECDHGISRPFCRACRAIDNGHPSTYGRGEERNTGGTERAITTIAQFSTTCPACGFGIEPDDVIYKIGDEWWCDECGSAEEQGTLSH